MIELNKNWHTRSSYIAIYYIQILWRLEKFKWQYRPPTYNYNARGILNRYLARLISVVETSFFFKWKLDHELWWTSNTFRTLSRAVFSKNRVNRFAPLWDKNSPENRVYLYQSHKCGIKKSNNSLDLHIIKYGFNILTRVLQAKETKILFVTLAVFCLSFISHKWPLNDLTLTSCGDLPWPPNETKLGRKLVFDLLLRLVKVSFVASITARIP